MLHYQFFGSVLKSPKLDTIFSDVPEPAQFEPKITIGLFSFSESLFTTPRHVRKIFCLSDSGLPPNRILPLTPFTGGSKGLAPALPQVVEQPMTGLAVGDGQEGKPLGQSRMPMTSGIDLRLPDTKG